MTRRPWLVAVLVAALSSSAVAAQAEPSAEPDVDIFAQVDPAASDPSPPVERQPAARGDTVLLVDGPLPSDLLEEVAAVELDAPPRLVERGVRRVAVAEERADELADALRDAGASVEVELLLELLRTPSDPLWKDQWGARQVGAPRLWDVTTGSSSVVIAVLDTGVDPHADLQGALVPGYDIIGGGSTSDLSASKHGTSVALVAAARANNGIGSAGYCWRCRIMPVRVLYEGGGFADDVALGIDAAVHGGADIINLSLGGSCDAGTDPIESAVRRAGRAGVLVIAAAGNSGSSTRTCPAATSGVIGVAGTGTDGRVDVQSNRGSWVDLAAPNCHVVAGQTSGGGFCGTSSAAPAVAGVAGALLAASPRFTPDVVEHVLRSTAAPISGVRDGRIRAGHAATRGTPVSGDWNGDGRETEGWFVDGRWSLRTSGSSVTSFQFGGKGDVPITGDWNGNGRAGIGIVRNGRWHLRNSLSGGSAQLPVFTFGRVSEGDVPITGDWNGNRRSGIGIVRNGRWHLRQTPSGGSAQVPIFTYGRVNDGDIPLTGDWSRRGRSGIGIVRHGTWHLRDQTRGGAADRQIRF